MNKRIILPLLALLFCFFSSFSQSILWKVSGKKMKSPSYVFGTIHIQDERVFAFDSTVLNALNSCEAFAAEVLLDKINAQELRQFTMMSKDQLLSDLLSKEDFALLDSICKAKLGVSAIFMNRMKPFFIASAIQQADIPQDMENALDLFLLKYARDNNKLCFGLEDYMDQIKAIDAFKMKDQIEMLTLMLHDTSTMSQEFGEMLNAYLGFDLDKLSEMSQDTSLPKEFEKVLLVNRNVKMVKQFLRISGEHTLFCAVGAAHLAGDKGIISLLRKKGYTVEPVIFSWEPLK